ncbi:MAG: S8 family serine peptidase [Bacteroidota bacterium]|nr:S8 family serine peptidase [Bacteroidota bacterium]
MKTYKFLFGCVIFFASCLAIFSDICYTQNLISGKEIKTTIWNNQEVQYVDREIAVKLRPGIQSASAINSLNQLGAVIRQNFDRFGWGLIEIPTQMDVFNAMSTLIQAPFFEVAEPNFVDKAAFLPNDPYFRGTPPATYAHQWGLHNTGQTPPTGTNDADIDAVEAWDITTGNPDVILAILDSGIPMLSGALSHPDLDDPNKIILGPDYIDEPGTEEYIEGVRDRLGHGTHVAGIASAETNNSEGVAGVAGGCKILVIQVFDRYGQSNVNAIYNAFIYSVDYQRNNPGKKVVINYSGGGPHAMQRKQAVQYAHTHGVTVVASSGNLAPTVFDYPAAYSTLYSNVIAVGATNYNDVRSSYSSYGPQLNVVAPGGALDSGYRVDPGCIFSTMPNYPVNLNGAPYYASQNYGYLFGTSMAAPHVAGTAALLLSIDSSLTPSQIRNILQQTADKVPGMGGNNFTNEYGYGRVNAYKAVKAVITPIILLSPSNCAIVSTSPTLSWNPLTGATTYRLQVATNNNFSNIVRDISGITSSSYQVTGLASTTLYYWRVSAFTINGVPNWSAIRFFTTSPPPASQLSGFALKRYDSQLGQLVLNPKLSWTTSGWCDVSYELYKYRCYQRGEECEPWDCGETGTVIYSGLETSYIDYWVNIGPSNCMTVHYYVKAVANVDQNYSVSNKVWFNDNFFEIQKQLIDSSCMFVSLPTEVALLDNFPDPFNPQTRIQYTLPEPTYVRLSVFDILGREVAVLVDKIEDAGYKFVNFDATDLSTGLYFYRLKTDKFSDVKKMLLAR